MLKQYFDISLDVCLITWLCTRSNVYFCFMAQFLDQVCNSLVHINVNDKSSFWIGMFNKGFMATLDG